MKKIKVSEATGATLDWLVAKCEGFGPDVYMKNIVIRCDVHGKCSQLNVPIDRTYVRWSPSTDWSQGGPIKTRELITTRPRFLSAGYQYPEGKWVWQAYLLGPENLDSNHEQEHESELAAAMRCYVVSKLGEEVEVPEELT